MAELPFQSGFGSTNTVFTHPSFKGPPGPKKDRGPSKPKGTTQNAKASTKTRGPYRPRGQPKQLPIRAPGPSTATQMPYLNISKSPLGPPGPPSPTSPASNQPLKPETAPGPARVDMCRSEHPPTQNSESQPILNQSVRTVNPEDQRVLANFGASMGEEYTMLYYRPSLQESYGQGAEPNPTMFYPLTRRLEQYPGLLEPGYYNTSHLSFLVHHRFLKPVKSPPKSA